MPHILIVSAGFYREIAEELVAGAVRTLETAGATYDIADVPGAFEIPGAIRMALESGRYHGYVALGCVIRGETTHYDYVCGESARGLNDLVLHYKAAIGYGILTVETVPQAWARAKLSEGDKGGFAAQAALRMIELKTGFGA